MALITPSSQRWPIMLFIYHSFITHSPLRHLSLITQSDAAILYVLKCLKVIKLNLYISFFLPFCTYIGIPYCCFCSLSCPAVLPTFLIFISPLSSSFPILAHLVSSSNRTNCCTIPLLLMPRKTEIASDLIYYPFFYWAESPFSVVELLGFLEGQNRSIREN